MKNQADIFYYINLPLLSGLLEHKSPPFIRQMNPNFSVIKSPDDNTMLYIDFDELINYKTITSLNSDTVYQIKKELISKSITKDKFVRAYFNTYSYQPCWKKTTCIAVGFNSSLVNDFQEALYCTPIDYEAFFSELSKKDLREFPIKTFLDTLFNPLIRDSSCLSKILMKDNAGLTFTQLSEINGSLLEICWDKPITNSVELSDFPMNLFVIGPYSNLGRKELRRILFLHGLFFEPTNINEYIWKLNYQFSGLERNWSDIYSR